MNAEIIKKDERPISARLADRDEAVRLAALSEALNLDSLPQELIPILSAKLQDEDEDCHTLAVLVLEKAGAAAVPHLIGALSPGHPAGERAFAANTLARMECDRTAAIPGLYRCLLDEDPGLREQGSLALSRIGAPAVPTLAAALLDASEAARKDVILTLGRIGPPAKDAIPALNRFTAGQPAEILIPLATAMVQISQDANNGVPFLLSAAASEPALRLQIVEKIGEIGSVARESSESLVPYLHDPSADVRAATALALARLWLENAAQLPDRILDGFVLALEDPEPKVRLHAGIAVSAFDQYADRTLPAVERHIGDTDEQVAAVARAAAAKLRGEKYPPKPPMPSTEGL